MDAQAKCTKIKIFFINMIIFFSLETNVCTHELVKQIVFNPDG